tara:strand:- start:176 stop:898 length:723 start_codon:yes stop_codon:yes gene_type:complete
MAVMSVSGSGETISTSSFPEGIAAAVTGESDSELDKTDRLSFLEKRIDLMLSCYVDNLRSNFEMPIMALDENMRDLLDYTSLKRKIEWLNDEYDLIRKRILSGEIPVDDSDFETIVTSNEILYGDEGEFILDRLYGEANLGKNPPKLDEMACVLDSLFDVADKDAKYRLKIREYMYEFLSLLEVDPREATHFENEPPLRYAQTVKQYELALIKEFERFGEVPNRLKEKHGISDTRKIRLH